MQALSDMIAGHCAQGIIVWNEATLVFGSSSQNEGRLCERLDLKTKQRTALPEMCQARHPFAPHEGRLDLKTNQWTALPEMRQARHCFAPAVLQSAVYLCGGGYIVSIECFDGVAMRLLTIRMPEDGVAIACSRGNTLLVLTPDYLTIISKTAEVSEPTVSVKKHRSCNIKSRPNPVWYDDIIFQYTETKLLKFSAEDGCILNN